MKQMYCITVIALFLYATFIACDKPTEPETGSLTITSDPSGARIYLRGDSTQHITPHTFKEIDVGSYSIKLQLQHYESWDSSVVVQKNKTTMVHATMLSVTGSIVVNSDPSGASIYIDRVYRGITPYTIKYVSIGNHEVKLTLADYADWINTIHVARDSTTIVEATLLKLVGGLTVTSEPSGASIWLNGTELGITTPATIDSLLATTHQLKLTFTDYQDYQQSVTVIAFDTVDIHVVLQHEVGNINIESDPQGVHITLDGTNTGFTTPYILTGVLTGVHQLSLSLFGYTTWSQSVLVEANKTTDVFADLVSIYGKIAVSSSPPGAAIHLDGVNTGLVTPNTLVDLNPGVYQVKLTLPAYLDYQEDVTVVAGETNIVKAQLIQAPTLLIIESNPSGAEIWINGNPTGNYTPDTLIDVAPGSYQVRTLYPDYFPADTTITVETGYTHIASLTHDLASNQLVAYTMADTIWITGLDGINSQVLAVDYDSWISAYVSYPGGMLWSPDGEYLVYTGLTNPITIITRQGDVEAGLIGSRSTDFEWSMDSRILLYGHYRNGIYRYNTYTNEFNRVVNTWCYCWDHCPINIPGNDSIIYFIHQEYGTRAYLYQTNINTGARTLMSNSFGTGFDEDINITLINEQQFLFETGSGMYILDLNDYTDSTRMSPIKVVEDNVSLMRLSNDKTMYAYLSSTGLHYGVVGTWTSSWLIKFPILYDFYWSPQNEAIACRTDDGIHWLTLNGQDYHIINYSTAGRGAVCVEP